MLYEKNLPKIIICPTCNGKGLERDFSIRENFYVTEPCSDCNEKGRVRRIINIKYEKL
jgi:DnaJ-class molecular chaperone